VKILYIALALLTFSGLSQAEDAPKSFSEMTYAELQQVDQKSLTKVSKKVYKKAFKSAKKAWKKAEKTRKKVEKAKRKAELKAEKAKLKAARKIAKAKKRAERASQRAERKRLKAIARAERKHARAIRKKLKMVLNTHKGTSIFRDDFEASIKISSDLMSQYDSAVIDEFGSGGRLKFFLRSFYFSEEDRLAVQAFVIVKFQELVNQETLDYLEVTPTQYATREHFWKRYRTAKLRGGRQRHLEQVDRGSHSCYGVCNFFESFTIDLDLEDLEGALANNKDLQIKLTARHARAMVLKIPRDYIMGHLWSISDTDSRLADLGDPAKEYVARVRATPMPQGR